MNKQFSEIHDPVLQHKMRGSAYAAHIQEAMRYSKLHSQEYPIAMTILRAVTQGDTEEQWKQEQQRVLTVLSNRPADKNVPFADAANRYEQMVANFKDLNLWPWE